MKSGLTFEQLQGIIAANAVDTIRNAKGGLRRNGTRIQVYFNYQVLDPSKPSGRRQVRVSRQTAIDAKKLNEDSYKKPDGSNRRRTINAFRNDIMEDVKTLRGVQSDPNATVGAVCKAYIDYKLGIGNATGKTGHGKGIRDTTASSMRKQLKRLERYDIYKMRLSDVTPTMVQVVVNDMCIGDESEGRKGLSGASIHGTISVLRSAARWCLGARADLPTDGVVLPSVGDRRDADEYDEDVIPAGRQNILTRAQFGNVLSTCAAMNTRGLESTGIAAILALTCGLREGECCALRWQDVHLDAEEPYIEVRHSLNKTIDSEGHGHFKVGRTKSRSSKRNVRIPASTVQFLRSKRAKVLEALLALDVAKGEVKPSIGDLFVCGDLAGNFKTTNALSNSWRGYCKRHGIHGTLDKPLSFHMLRDSYASALIDDGVPVLRVSHLLGHESIDITIRRYVHGNDSDAFESISNHEGLFLPSAEGKRDGTNG